MKLSFKIFFVFVLMNFYAIGFSQSYLLPNEVCIISFKTKNNKIVMLAKDKDNKYLVYRFGSKDKIELQFPDKLENSWSKFKFSYYSRGGGKLNAAQELRHVSFINADYKYILYDTYHSESDEFNIGVRVFNLNTKESTDFEGKLKTKKGALSSFKESKLLKEDEEI